MASRDEANQDVPVFSVSLKLPTFWPDSAKAWFAQTDAQFAIKRITSSETKFYYCVAALSKEDAEQLADLICSPPSSEPYETLKRRLFDLYELNSFQRFESFISLPFSADMKPSHLMSKMLHLLPEDHKPGFFVRGHFLRRLPAEIRSHLLQEDIKDPRALARKADELWQNSNVAALNALSHASEDQEVQDVFAVSSRPAPRSSSRPKSGRSVPSRPSSSSRSSPAGWCWYHKSHGEEAQRCKSPCSYVPGN